ncbi:hypothetical protein Taro_042949 [Colocasia esculenta]|uniref:Uncharacterized protein n=1 Tax=Colocasia esculenta TaxID=4460 RepID=A0A843WI70_COLES|nr:hypothetical protein [Colocasia esculenta]
MPSSTSYRAAGSTTEQHDWLTEQATCSVPSSQENPSSPSFPHGSYNGYATRAPRSSGALTAERLNAKKKWKVPGGDCSTTSGIHVLAVTGFGVRSFVQKERSCCLIGEKEDGNGTGSDCSSSLPRPFVLGRMRQALFFELLPSIASSDAVQRHWLSYLSKPINSAASLQSTQLPKFVLASWLRWSEGLSVVEETQGSGPGPTGPTLLVPARRGRGLMPHAGRKCFSWRIPEHFIWL